MAENERNNSKIQKIPRYLFLCGHGAKRSPTAARIGQKIADRQDKNVDISFGGIHYASQDIEIMRSYWASFDVIFALDRYVESKLVTYYEVPRDKIVNLDISDNYERDDLEMVETLEEKLKGLI